MEFLIRLSGTSCHLPSYDLLQLTDGNSKPERGILLARETDENLSLLRRLLAVAGGAIDRHATRLPKKPCPLIG